jgi:hypothetical protein
MKQFNRMAAQGDVMFIKIDAIPDGVTEALPEPDGNHVITHSETGHHHVMNAARVKRFLPNEGQSGGGGMVSYIAVKEPTPITHLRPHDTHAPIMFGPGNYEIRRQREYTPQGWRRVED